VGDGGVAGAGAHQLLEIVGWHRRAAVEALVLVAPEIAQESELLGL
jgi:hypothetical protein